MSLPNPALWLGIELRANGRATMSKRTESVVNIQGRQLKLSNLEKVLYPAAAFSKAQLIDYYVRIAPVLLPHLRGRPLTMKRYPEGVGGMHFYEKNCPTHRPARPWRHSDRQWDLHTIRTRCRPNHKFHIGSG